MSNAIILPHEIGFGKNRKIQTLLADRWRKLVLIRVRRGAHLADHSARVAINSGSCGEGDDCASGARSMC